MILSYSQYPSYLRVNGNEVLTTADGMISHQVLDGVDITRFDKSRYLLNGEGEMEPIDGIEMVQSVRVVGDKYEIKYRIENTGTEAIDVGFKFNLPTVVGDEERQNTTLWVDGEHLENNTQYVGESIPSTFQVKNFVSVAEVVGEGIIKSTGPYEIIEEPSMVALGTTGVIGNNTYYDNYTSHGDWNTPLNEHDDAGVSLIWEDRTVEAGDFFEVNFFWGLATPDEYKMSESTEPPSQPGSENQEGNYDSIIQNRGLILQVGPNTGNQFKVPLSDVRTESLGLENLHVETLAGANQAIEEIDSALETVLSERAKYGAFTNALVHIQNNGSNYSLNLAEAESRIRDVNMAKEIMKQTKHSILAQASQAMLAQSNQIPQGVLQLLK